MNNLFVPLQFHVNKISKLYWRIEFIWNKHHALSKRRDPAEKCSCRSTKKANLSKPRRFWSKRGTSQPAALITSADNSWPPALPFHAALIFPQPNIFTIFQHASPSQTHSPTLSLTHSHRQTRTPTHIYSLTHSPIHSLTQSFTHSLTHTLIHTHAQKEMHKEAWICSTEEFLELHGKVENVVRNCLMKWLG